MKLLICTQAMDINHPILGFFQGWVKEFAKHFDEVHVICLQKGTVQLPSNVFVYSLGKEEGENKLKYLFRFYKYFSKIFFGVRVDFVFFHMGAIFNIVAAPFYFLRHLYRTKFYWWKAHGFISNEARMALRFVDEVITSTESGFNIPTNKRRVVGQAIDIEKFAFAEDVREERILFVGRIMPIKRIEDFLETAKILNSEFPKIKFSIIGPVGDENYFKKLQNQIDSKKMNSYVRFEGSRTQDELVLIYQKTSIFLNTSLTHSMDKTILEALLCGCISVTGNKAFAKLLGAHGLYMENATAVDYSKVIRLLLKKDTADLRHILRNEVASAHSLDTFSKRIFNL